MTEPMTLVIMIFLAAIGGTMIAVMLKKQNKYVHGVKAVFSWFLCCYFEYWLMNVWRTLVLEGTGIYAYSQNYALLIIDIIIVIVGVLFIYHWHEKEVQCYAWIRVTLVAAVICCYVVLFAVNYQSYRNLNAAIYYSLAHNTTTFLGLLLYLVYGLFHSFFEDNIQEKPEKADVAAIGLFIMTVIVYPVLETYLVNASEFSFSLGAVGGWFFLAILLAILGIALLYVVMRGKLRRGYVLFLWCFSICTYIQAMFLNGKLFLMDGKATDWSMGLKIGNAAIWCIVFLVLAICCVRLKEKSREVVLFTSVVLCLMQLVGGISLLPNYLASEEKNVRGQKYLSTQGLYEVAKEENIVIFVLDTYDVEHIDEVLQKYPDFLEPLKGFTYFPDMVAQFSRTFPSVPYMLTGEKYFYEIPLNEYVTQAFENCSIWDGLKEKGYELYFYEEDEAYIASNIREEAENYVEEGHTIEEKVSFWGCVESMCRINGYRLLPYALKEYYFYTAGTISDLVVEEFTLEKPEFVADDARVYQGFRGQRLQINEEEKALRFIHLYGAHEPYVMDENGNSIEAGEGSAVAQYIGCMNMMYDYIAMLQELGIYENTTIIITADHGENFLDEQLKETTNPILFIKPYGVGADEEMVISDKYASQEDILSTLASLHDIEYTEGKGLDLFTDKNNYEDRIRYHYYTVVEGTTQTKIREYEIKGCSLELQNWNATEVYHEFGEYR